MFVPVLITLQSYPGAGTTFYLFDIPKGVFVQCFHTYQSRPSQYHDNRDVDVMGAAALPDDCSIAHRTLSANKSKNQPLNSSCAPEFVKGQAGAQLSSLLAVNNFFFLFFSPNFLCTTDIRSIKFRCPCPRFCVFTMMKRWKIK